MKLFDDDLAARCSAVMQRHRVPGLTACVIKNGTIARSVALGVKNEHGEPIAEDTLFEAASLTKPLFAAFFLAHAQRGDFAMDVPVVLQGGEVWSCDPRFAHICPRHCLCHGSGLPDWAAQPMELLFAPGSSYSYSGEGYYLLQKLAEKKLGSSWTELIRRELLQPCRMDTSVYYNEDIGARMSCGFGTDGSIRKRRTEPDREGNAPEPNAAWSLYANARLYAQFVCTMMQERCGLSEPMFREMTRPANHAAAGIDWGLGWGISEGLLWHWGDNSGFQSFVIWDPSDNSGITVFTNSDNGRAAYTELIYEMTGLECLAGINRFIDTAERAGGTKKTQGNRRAAAHPGKPKETGKTLLKINNYHFHFCLFYE